MRDYAYTGDETDEQHRVRWEREQEKAAERRYKEIQNWYISKQTRYNCILAMTTLILALATVLQVLKTYEVSMPNWVVVLVFGIPIAVAAVIAFTELKKEIKEN